MVTPTNPYILNGKMATVLDDQSDVSYTHILKEYENVKDLKLENDEYCWMDIKNSLTSSDIQSAFLYVFSDPDCWKEKEALHKKISLAKKNGEYYQNPENFKKLEYLI